MKVRFLIAATLVTLVWVAPATAHLPVKPKCESLKCRAVAQTQNLAHSQYVCSEGAGHHKKWSCRAVKWLTREMNKTVEALQPDWATVQIRYATLIAEASGEDPWPNCPDPYDGSGGAWWNPDYPADKSTTLGCENGGSWYDSPGYYRCGLQFDPGWEYKYGRKFCP